MAHRMAWRAERRGGVGDELRVVHRRAVDRHLVGAGGDHTADVGNAAETAAHAVRQMQLRAGAACKVHRGLALVAGGGDIKEDHLVGALLVVALRQLDGVARIAQVHEVDPLHHTAVLHVHAGDHAFCQHISAPQRLGERGNQRNGAGGRVAGPGSVTRRCAQRPASPRNGRCSAPLGHQGRAAVKLVQRATPSATSSVPSYTARPVMTPSMLSATGARRSMSARLATPPLAMTGLPNAFAMST